MVCRHDRPVERAASAWPSGTALMPPQMHSSAKAASTRDSDSQTAVKDDIGRSISGKAKKKMMITTSGGSDRMTSAKITIGTDSHGRRTARSTASARPNHTPVTEQPMPPEAVIPHPINILVLEPQDT